MDQKLIQAVLFKRADWLARSGVDVLVVEAQWLRSFGARMGDLGEEQEEIEILPLHEPVVVPKEVPAEPERVPA